MPVTQSSFNTKLAINLFVIIALIAILYIAQPLLAPLAFGLVFALLLVPLSRWLQKAGLNICVAAVICVLVLITAFALIFGLLGWQLSTIMEDAGQLKQKLHEVIGQVQSFISQRFGIKPAEQQKMVDKSNMAEPITWITQSAGQLFGLLVDVILTLVYVLLLLIFRRHFLTFIARAVPGDERQNVAKLLEEAAGVAQKYLTGLALMIMTLWVMYAIGFSVAGLHYAIFFALLCGTLEMVPFVGNLTGTTLAALMGILQGGGPELVITILVIYGLVQFIQSYLLEPLIVGRQVNLNPFFTIFSIVIGEMIWGIAGMVLAIPFFGMLKIACDHFDALKPYGFLLGGNEKQEQGPGVFLRVKKWFGSAK
jgi:predicted PurR-regulated permease PerM